jgi:hypothetical protein
MRMAFVAGVMLLDDQAVVERATPLAVPVR